MTYGVKGLDNTHPVTDGNIPERTSKVGANISLNFSQHLVTRCGHVHDTNVPRGHTDSIFRVNLGFCGPE